MKIIYRVGSTRRTDLNRRQGTMSAKYPPTPGPWYCISGAVYADLEGTRPIAQMIRTDAATRAGIFPVERDSNAHLIAAAPEMAALLLRLSEATCDHSAQAFCLREDARVLLAKIRGNR